MHRKLATCKMDHQTRFVGDYELGRRLGSGSFAVVWRSKHRDSGVEVAVKEIDKKLLSPKVSENLRKEISILSTMRHPNIIRLFESIESEDRIYLVLEYCDGGDLGAYIHRHAKVSEAVARHLMRQLAAGLQVLQENHLIHRDLKPQNLLLSSNDEYPLLKIGDFGFARSLTPHGLADTLCGSPLYMAPEIIQNQKYDAKADLWSVGAILFQLVTGKTPFDGNSHYQLFQNILTSTELQFPQGALEELHPDCVNLCRSLLRRNPVERSTFKEFFDHSFLRGPRLDVDVEQLSLVQEIKPLIQQSDSSSDKMSQMHSEQAMCSASRNPTLYSSLVHDYKMHGKVNYSESGTVSVDNYLPKTRRSVDGSKLASDPDGVVDSMEFIEKDYVLVNCRSASVENFSYYSETSLQENSVNRVFVCLPMCHNQNAALTAHTDQLAASPVYRAGNSVIQGQSTLQPSAKLRLLNQYVQALSELAHERHNAGLLLESFAVELVVLAIWKKAFHICSSWVASTSGCEVPSGSSDPLAAYKWAEQEFVAAYDRVEKLSYHIQDMDAGVKMPDAMEIIFQKALAVGTSGAVDEYMENRHSAALSYLKAMLLLSFIAEEATSLPLKPPFSLTPADKTRIQKYIMNLEFHQSHIRL